MKDSDVRNYIKSMLGANGNDEGKGLNIELHEDDYRNVISQTLAKLAPYYNGKRYFIADTDVVDLSEVNLVAVTNVFNVSNSVLLNAQDFAFGGQNIIIYNADFRERYISYTAYMMLYKEYDYLRSQSWRLVGNTLYIHGFQKATLVEILVRPTVVSDIEQGSQYCSWVMDYALALAKEVVGRKRSKYIVEGSPYQLDGDKLLAESQSEKANLEAQLIGDIFVI